MATESLSLVLVSKANGYVIIPQATPLTRLNYFDGKFLRASDLKAEQDYLRQLVALSNQAGGAGVAHGFDLTLGSGDSIEIGAGLAIDPSGRVLLLPQGRSINVQELIEKSRALQKVFGKTSVLRSGEFEECELATALPAVDNAAPNDLYVIVISPADALCGEEDVYGKLCEEACATSTDRPFAVEGLMVRAVPLILRTPLPSPKVVALSQAHLRSRVASSYFEDERRLVANLISKAGLSQETWCLGADAAGGSGVPIGVIARAGSTTVFLDAWIARRERIDAPAKRYWQWRMMMRPWDVFLAQVLQFQCQLHDLFAKVITPGGGDDPCGGARGALTEAAATIAELKEFYTATAQRFTTMRVNPDEALTFKGGLTRLTALNEKLVKVSAGLNTFPADRLLINGGIIELPSAGYLPVVPGSDNTVNQQVRRMMGEGVDLRFCVVRPDFVAHALEEAQHMERISLLEGLDSADRKPEVDILVPNGQVLEQKQLSPGTGFEASVDINQLLLSPRGATGFAVNQPVDQVVNFRGAARREILASGGGAFYLSAEHQVRSTFTAFAANNAESAKLSSGSSGASRVVDSTVRDTGFSAVKDASIIVNTPPKVGLWISLRCEDNIFGLGRGDTTNFNARAIVASSAGKGPLLDVEFNGVFQVTQASSSSGAVKKVLGRTENARLSFTRPGSAVTNILFNCDVAVTLTGVSAIQVELISGKQEIAITADWGKEPLAVTARIVERASVPGAANLETELADVDLKENPDVLTEKNSRHVEALAALEVIGKILNDTDFADAKARLLFPPPPKPTDELLVRATMDWVLFHRRRTKRCSQEVCVAPVSAEREYQVYHLKVDGTQAVEPTKKKLLAGGMSENDFNKLPLVEFAGGVATLITDPKAWREDWSHVNPGNSIVYAGIANRDTAAADGDTLALTRLSRVVDTVAPVSTPNAQMETELLTQVPSSIPAAGADGAIFIFTSTITETKNADLGITMTANQTDFEEGTPITFTIEASNLGPDIAENVKISFPDGVLLFGSASSPSGWTRNLPPAGTSGPSEFTKPQMASGEKASFQIETRVSNDAPTILDVEASIESSTADPVPANNNVVVKIFRVDSPKASLKITKSASPTTAPSGSTITFTINLTCSNQNALGARVTDILPDKDRFVSAKVVSGTGWIVSPPPAGTVGGEVRFNKAEETKMLQGETAVFEVVIKEHGGVGPITNTAIAEASNDPNTDNKVTVTVNITEPNLVKTGLVVFTQQVTAGRQVLQGSQKTAVKFTNNVPDATILNNALKGFPTGMSLGRFRRITLAGTLAPLDAEANKRLDAVANAVIANGGTVLGKNTEAFVSAADRNGLAAAAINLTGIDEVIFLDMG